MFSSKGFQSIAHCNPPERATLQTALKAVQGSTSLPPCLSRFTCRNTTSLFFTPCSYNHHLALNAYLVFGASPKSPCNGAPPGCQLRSCAIAVDGLLLWLSRDKFKLSIEESRSPSLPLAPKKAVAPLPVPWAVAGRKANSEG